MNTKELIGRIIKDILVWSKMEVGGLDEAQVFIQLDNGSIIRIPWDFDDTDIECSSKEYSKSLFANLKDTSIYHINEEGKTIEKIIEAKKQRASSILGRLKKAIGITKVIPKEYRTYKTEYLESKVDCLKDKKIVDFLMFENYGSVGFLELENGYIITETTIAPHGTGMAGLNHYENLKILEDSKGSNYKRLINISHYCANE
jgi:hypothetical protein